jgi:Phosphatidylinositol 3- and 4-kinase
VRTLFALALALSLLQTVSQTPAATAGGPAATSKIWLGRHAAFEQFLRTAEIVEARDIPKATTRPRHAFFAPGGLAAGAIIKAIKPDLSETHFDSYRSEIAAYELDKLLGMDMVPPTVERRYETDLVSAQLWVENCVSYKTVMDKPMPDADSWNRQLRRMIVFDNLAVNRDRNAGNMLVDPAGNLILIDHSRAFDGRLHRLPFEKEMARIDRPFFERLKALDREALQAHVGPWVDFGVGPILLQREFILRRFENLIKENGEASVIVE